MSRWIDADALIEKKWQTESEACFYALEDVVSVTDIEETPSIDLVRCKECKWFPSNMDETNSDEDYLMCPMDKWTNADDFCSCGERKESD